jgi:hypothetical protein
VGRWATLLENATIRGAIRRALHHRLAAPSTPTQRRFPREKKC